MQNIYKTTNDRSFTRVTWSIHRSKGSRTKGDLSTCKGGAHQGTILYTISRVYAYDIDEKIYD